jgi:biopolymer transport protein ExbD
MDSQPTPSFANHSNQPLTYRPRARGTDRLALNIRPDFAGWSPSALAKSKIRKRRAAYLCRVDLCAVAAVFFAMLALLMCQTPSYHDLPENAVDLFHAGNARPLLQARREDSLRVAVSRDGNIYFETGKVRLEDLPRLFTGGIEGGSERRVYLLVDQRAAYRDVKPVLQAVHDAGIRDISFWAWKN